MHDLIQQQQNIKNVFTDDEDQYIQVKNKIQPHESDSFAYISVLFLLSPPLIYLLHYNFM